MSVVGKNSNEKWLILLFYRLLPWVMAAVLVFLAFRAYLRLEIRWDSPRYHIPFAALRAGLPVSFSFGSDGLLAKYYEGFPPLAHFVQGMLWRITGSIQAVGLANILAFVGFLLFCQVKLNARFWLVALIALTAPLVLIEMTSNYIDLFGNAFLALGISVYVYRYFFDCYHDRSLLLGGLLGLTAAAWSKFQLAPVVGLFFVLFMVQQWLAGRRSTTGEAFPWALVSAMLVLAAAPYLKNLTLYGNPLWPLKLPVLSAWLPYFPAADMIALTINERPPMLQDYSQPLLFVHSLFEINHPIWYPHRERWIIDQGTTSAVSFRMGGFWALSVGFYVLAMMGTAIVYDRRKGLVFTVGSFLVLAAVSLLPQSHELRYYLFIPLCWASIIAMLFPTLERRFPLLALGLLIAILGLFGYVSRINKAYYTIEKITMAELGAEWNMHAWWYRLLQKDVKYCVVGMEPTAALFAGPSWSEFSIVERSDKRNCPVGTTVVNNYDIEGIARLHPLTQQVVTEFDIKEQCVQLMSTGMDLLYYQHNSSKAAKIFQEVLLLNPEHYGALFQLGEALAAQGQRLKAREAWKRAQTRAQQLNDWQTLELIRKRLDS